MEENPYATPTSKQPVTETGPNRVAIRPWSRLSDAKDLMGDQYLLFVGICFVALIINAIVPFNILLGPLACGIHMCFSERANGERTLFETLFRGFDHFVPSLLVTLLMIVFAIVIFIPLVIIAIAVITLVATYQPNEEFAGIVFATMFVPMVMGIIGLSMMVYMPFLFAFALIVDKHMQTWDAVTASWDGVRRNFWGLFGMLLLYGLIGVLAALPCYIPLFFVVPLQAGALFLIYRDVFPSSIATA